MGRSRPPIRVEMLFGALYGLGLTVSVWLPLSSPGLRGGEGLLFAGLAGLAGALTAELIPRWRLFAAYPAILAAQLVHGVGAAVMTGVVAALVWVLLASERVRKERAARLLLDLSKLSLATALAGLVHALVPALHLVAHACAFAAVDLALSGVAGCWSTPRWCGGKRRPRLPHAIGPVASCPAGWAVAAAYTGGDAGAWLWLVPWTMAAIHVGRRLAQRSGRSFPAPLTHRSASIYRGLTLGLARAASSTDPALAGHQQRVERMSRAVGERLGLPQIEIEALSAAALLHESDRIWLLDAPTHGLDLATLPTLAAELVSLIRFPYEVLPVVRHARERWDGTGRPDGLVGEAIPRGARILAAADYCDSITSGRRDGRAVSPASVLAKLRAEAGSRLDPVVVDLLVEHLQERGHPKEPHSELPELSIESEPYALRAGERELELLGQHRRAARAKLGVDDRLTLIAARTGVRLAHRAFVVYLADEAKSRLVPVFAFGEPAECLSTVELPADRGIFGLALAEGRAVVANPADLPQAFHEATGDCDSAASGLIAPLGDRGRALGVLVLYDAAERRFTSRDRDLAVRAARIVASVVAEGAGHDATRVELTDPTTGLPNARYLRLAVARRLPGPGWSSTGFGLVALASHDGTGQDRRLSGAARRLAAMLEPGETLARFGPEQFVLLTPAHRPADLVERSRRIVAAISTTTEQVRSSHAAYPADGETLDELLSALDARIALGADSDFKLLAFRAGAAERNRRRSEAGAGA